jgi:hypothetical protein
MPSPVPVTAIAKGYRTSGSGGGGRGLEGAPVVMQGGPSADPAVRQIDCAALVRGGARLVDVRIVDIEAGLAGRAAGHCGE